MFKLSPYYSLKTSRIALEMKITLTVEKVQELYWPANSILIRCLLVLSQPMYFKANKVDHFANLVKLVEFGGNL